MIAKASTSELELLNSKVVSDTKSALVSMEKKPLYDTSYIWLDLQSV